LNYKELEKYILKRSVIVSIVIGSALFFLSAYKGFNTRAIVFGWLLGSFVQMISFKYLLCRSVEKSVKLDPKQAYGYTYVQYILRLFFYAAALIIGFKFLKLNIVAIGAGLLVVRIAIFFETVVGVLKQSKCKEVQ